MKGNVIQMNTLHLNSVRLNGIGKVQSVSLKGGSTEDPVFPPVEPPVEPEPTPTYTLSASVTNGKVSATLNGSAVNLPYTANEGDTIVLSVTPNDGYTFEGWNDGNTDNPRSITMTADVVLSAQCVEVVVPPVDKYIQFEDAEVERVLMSKGVSSDGVGITMEDAAAVTSISTWFKGNNAITFFDELRYFTGVTKLDNFAFQNCTNLLHIDLSNIEEIGATAFGGCPLQMPRMSLPRLKKLLANAFPDALIEYWDDMGSVTTLESGPSYRTFGSSATLKGVTLPSGVTKLPTAAFLNYPQLKYINTENIIEFGASSLKNTAVESLDFTSAQILREDCLRGSAVKMNEFYAPNLTILEYNALYNLPFTSVNLGKVVNAPKGGSVYHSYGSKQTVKEIIFPETVVSMGIYALYNYNKLNHIICRAVTPPQLAGADTFYDTNNCPIYVPDASVEAYKTATNWSSYASRIKGISE